MHSKVRELVLAAVFAALTAVGGFLKIPFGPMFITLQTMLAALAGMVLGPRWGAASQGVYLALGLLGLPIFTMGGKLEETAEGGVRLAGAAAVGILAGYAIGVPYMGLILNLYLGKGLSLWQVVESGLVIYLPGEAVKVAATAVVAPPLMRALRAEAP